MSNINTNFLQPTGFKLIIDRQKFANLEWFAQSVDHPSVGNQPAIEGYRRVTDVGFPGDKLEFPEVSFNIILDEEMASYTEAYNWLKRLVEEKYTPPTSSSTNRLPSECDITLLILNSSNIRQKSIIYRNAFPTNIGGINMSAENDPQPMVVPISFKYLTFEIK
jgi:hypothetical protein